MPLGRMLDEMSSAELTEQLAFDQIEADDQRDSEARRSLESELAAAKRDRRRRMM